MKIIWPGTGYRGVFAGGNETPLIDRETFEQIQEQLEYNKHDTLRNNKLPLFEDVAQTIDNIQEKMSNLYQLAFEVSNST